MMELRHTLVDDSVPSRSRRIGFRVAMLVGAGLTIGVWVFAGVYFTQRIDTIQKQAEVTSTRYVRAQELLADARNQVLLSSIYLREALLDPVGFSVPDSRVRLGTALDQAEQSLERYVPILDRSGEAERVAHFRNELAGLRHEMEDLLAIDPAVWRIQAASLLRGRLMRRREVVIGVANDLGALNRTAYVEYQAQIASTYRAIQNQGWQVLGLAVAASMGIAGFAARYGGRLERRVEAQRLRDRVLRADLQRLSSAVLSAREEERRHVARELHDEIGQLLTATKVELAVAQRAPNRNNSAEHFDEARRVVDRALHAVRDLSHLLHPAVLDDLGLAAAVEAHVRTSRRRSTTEISVTQDLGARRLSAECERAAYRIVQESLSNIVRHANAARCVISLRVMDGRLVIDIDDDGKGFDSAAMGASSGLGLISMRERVAQLRGTLVIQSGGGHGTRIHVELPIDAGSDEVAPDKDAL